MAALRRVESTNERCVPASRPAALADRPMKSVSPSRRDKPMDRTDRGQALWQGKPRGSNGWMQVLNDCSRPNYKRSQGESCAVTA